MKVSRGSAGRFHRAPRGTGKDERWLPCDKREAGKRDRLVAGARETIYRQGFEATTMGRRDARDLAFARLASYEGIALLANTFRDPELMIREGHRLERWIDSLARDPKDAPTG